MKTQSGRLRHGFTLTEVMVSMGVFLLLGAMIFTLIISTNRSLYDSQNKGAIDRNFRSTTSTLAQIVSCSDFLYIFKAQNDDPVKLAAAQVAQNLTGDYLVTVFYKNPGRVDAKTGQMDTTVSRITGICRIPDGAYVGGPGAVYMFDSAVQDWGVSFPVASDAGVGSITALLPNRDQIKGFTKLADAAFPSNATEVTPDVGIFMNKGGTGAIMMARIRSGSPGKYVSNGYTFSISSRNL